MKHLVYTWLQTHRWLALAGGMALLGVYLLVVDLTPRIASTYALFEAWRQHQVRIASVTDGTVKQAHLEARRQQLQERLADLYVSLPRSDQLSTLIQVLQESADAVGVGLQEIRPTERTAFAGYDALPFQVVLQGSFHEIALFIHRIEQSSYVIKVRQVQFQRASISSNQLRADVSLNVIVLKEQQGAP